MKKLFLLLLISILLSGCSENSDWTGFYYPDKNNIGDEFSWIIEPGLNSLEECQDWVADTAGTNTNYDYECGYKCRYDNNYGMNICEETLK